MTKQELFLNQFGAQRSQLQDVWWKCQDLQGEINYWQYELDMRTESLTIALDSFTNKFGLDRSRAGVLATIFVSPFNMIADKVYKNIPLPVAAYATSVGGNSNSFMYIQKYNQSMLKGLVAFNSRLFPAGGPTHALQAVPYWTMIAQGQPEEEIYSAFRAFELKFINAVLDEAAKFVSIPGNDLYKKTLESSSGLYTLNAYAPGAPGEVFNWSDPLFVEDLRRKTLDRFESIYKPIIDFIYAARFKDILEESQANLKRDYDARVVKFKSFLDVSKADPELQSIVPDASSEIAIVQGAKKPSPIPPQVLAPPIEPKPDLVVAINPPAPVLQEAQAPKKSLAPWIIAAGAAAYFLSQG